MLRDSFVFIASLVGPSRYHRFAPYQPKVDYIGPEAWTKRKALKPLAWAARFAWGFDLNVAGWLHDELYRLGGTEADRLAADNFFLTCMLWLIDTVKAAFGFLQRHLARLRAQAFYSFVREEGQHFFSYTAALS